MITNDNKKVARHFVENLRTILCFKWVNRDTCGVGVFSAIKKLPQFGMLIRHNRAPTDSKLAKSGYFAKKGENSFKRQDFENYIFAIQ